MVIVIGAGLAGLACARELRAHDEEVIVVEGRQRLGGRVVTDTTLGRPVDLGASWIHGHRRNPLTQLARQHELSVHVSDYGLLGMYDEEGRLDDAVAIEAGELSEWLYEWAEELCHKHPKSRPDMSLGAAMAAAMARGTRVELGDARLFDWALTSMGMSEGIDVGQVTLRYFEDDDPFEGDELLMVDGYRGMVQALAEGLDVRLGHHVESVSYDESGCEVRTSRGVLRADRVVVTLPLGVLKRGEVVFEPPLPQAKQRAVEGLGVGLLNKLAVRFEASFWDGEDEVLAKLSGPLRFATWVLNAERVVRAPILVGFLGGEAAREAEARSDETLLAEFLEDLRACFGDRVTPVEAYVVTRWHGDAYARGAYSYIPVGSTGMFYNDLAAPVAQRLFFAGEATHRDHPATAHGALLSGQRAAEEILELGGV